MEMLKVLADDIFQHTVLTQQRFMLLHMKLNYRHGHLSGNKFQTLDWSIIKLNMEEKIERSDVRFE